MRKHTTIFPNADISNNHRTRGHETRGMNRWNNLHTTGEHAAPFNYFTQSADERNVFILLSILGHKKIMSTRIDSYGTYAGTVWHVLSTKGELSEEKLRSLTALHDEELYTAIGWLARENKICQQPQGYRIGETNLVHTIGKNAGMIWRALDIWGDVSFQSLVRLARLSEKDCYAALGWLAREGKLDVAQDQHRTFLYRLV